MSRKNILYLLLDLIFIFVFNIIFFVSGGSEHEASVWIAYGFIHFSYIMLLLTGFLTSKTTNTATLTLPLYFISTIYFIVTFLVGIIFFIAHPASYKSSLIIQIIISGIYFVILITNIIANDKTAESISTHEQDLQYMKKTSAQLQSILNSATDKATRKNIERLYDLLHSSPAKSNNSVKHYEITVMNLIEELRSLMYDGDNAAINEKIIQIEQIANERNNKLKYSN